MVKFSTVIASIATLYLASTPVLAQDFGSCADSCTTVVSNIGACSPQDLGCLCSTSNISGLSACSACLATIGLDSSSIPNLGDVCALATSASGNSTQAPTGSGSSPTSKASAPSSPSSTSGSKSAAASSSTGSAKASGAASSAQVCLGGVVVAVAGLALAGF